MSATLLYVLAPEDKPYLHRLKALVGNAHVYLMEDTDLITWTQVEHYAKSKSCSGIISSSRKLLAKCVWDDDKPSLDSYAGSYFHKAGLEVVFIDPLAHLISVPYGSYLTARYISKLVYPEKWVTYPKFEYSVLSPENAEELYEEFKSADLLSTDIETTKHNLAITSIAYTAVFLGNGGIRFRTTVLPIDSDFNLAWMRKFNSLPVAKVFQNGKYDVSYLMRYNATPVNWVWDTATQFHCWLAELPKDLGFLSSFFHREGKYWKDMRESPDQSIKLEYNARDTYATAIACLQWFLESPAWAKTNYQQEFPLNFPALLCEMTGIKRDMERLKLADKEAKETIDSESSKLDRMLGVKGFNVNSPKQMKALLKILGCGDLESADEKNLNKAAFRHPLISRIVDSILAVRGARKLASTYLVEGKEHKGRILYSLIPHGTDTGRLASREHHFWCGLQVQNIPRGKEVKQTLIADDDFLLAEVDLEQAESRDTGYISGDPTLINNVENSPDFHSSNASMFFGVPFEEIYDVHKEKVLNKALRTLAKPVNHGANYNMGEGVLVETMGLKAIYQAQALLKLNKLWSPKQIAGFLLSCFHKTYKTLKTIYYPGVVHEVQTTRMLTSKAIHHSPYHVAGWVRYCFSDPTKDKRALNAYVAHPPQSLNALTLNKAFMRVFYEIAINPVHSHNFRLLAQIHDSILFQFRKGHEYLAEKVKEIMEVPVTIKAYDGQTRTFTVPAAIKAGKEGKGAVRWSETE